MTLKLLCDAYGAMERARTSDELRVEMARFARDMGFEHFAYALTVKVPSVKVQQYFINGFPDPWLDRYLKAGYFKVDMAAYPTVQRIADACMANDAFARAHPLKQPGAPATLGH